MTTVESWIVGITMFVVGLFFPASWCAVVELMLALLLSQAIPPIPGAIDPHATREMVCRPGYAASVRPSQQWSVNYKRQLLRKAGLPRSASAQYQADHLQPLELGGMAKDPLNIWLQPIVEAHAKDAMENLLHRQVCSGEMPLAKAQAVFLGEWWNSYAFKRIRERQSAKGSK